MNWFVLQPPCNWQLFFSEHSNITVVTSYCSISISVAPFININHQIPKQNNKKLFSLLALTSTHLEITDHYFSQCCSAFVFPFCLALLCQHFNLVEQLLLCRGTLRMFPFCLWGSLFTELFTWTIIKSTSALDFNSVWTLT